MPKTYACPYFWYEREGNIVCEAGGVKPDLRNDYINTYCASLTNYTHCTLARTLTLQYETRPQPVKAAGKKNRKGGKRR
jgi:hypothetical protein